MLLSRVPAPVSGKPLGGWTDMTSERVASANVVVCVAAFFGQIALASYRGYVQVAPSWMGVLLAPFFLLPLALVRVHIRPVRIALQTIGWVLLCIGLFAIWGAVANPVMSFVERISCACCRG